MSKKAMTKRAASGPSLAGFITWLKKKPARAEYNWGDAEKCACAQYFKGDWDKHDLVTKKDGVRLDGLAIERPRTYGALLKRAIAAKNMNRVDRGLL